jgi:transposase
MELMHARCAGLDVHKDTVVASIRVVEGRPVKRETRTFGTLTRDLQALRSWLADNQVTHVAMEATGVYWLPVWHVLEGQVELMLANPAHVKNVPGRKTDVKDAEWLAELLAHGLIRASFVPPQMIQDLRHLTRDRVQLEREQTRHVQRIQKVLQDANIKIDSVISDLMGQSGRAFLDAIVEGEADAEALASLGSSRLAATREELVEALRGSITDHHRRAIKRELGLVDALARAVVDIDTEVAALLEPFQRQVAHLATMPGVSVVTASVIIAEIGVDMSRFPTADHLISWAGLSPRSDESAGKQRSTRIGKGGNWLKTTLVQGAWAATRSKGTHLRELFMRLKGRRGPKKAIIAVAAEMLRSAWYILKQDEPYRERGDAARDPVRREQAAKRLVRNLKKLGYQVDLCAATT